MRVIILLRFLVTTFFLFSIPVYADISYTVPPQFKGEPRSIVIVQLKNKNSIYPLQFRANAGDKDYFLPASGTVSHGKTKNIIVFLRSQSSVSIRVEYSGTTKQKGDEASERFCRIEITPSGESRHYHSTPKITCNFEQNKAVFQQIVDSHGNTNFGTRPFNVNIKTKNITQKYTISVQNGMNYGLSADLTSGKTSDVFSGKSMSDLFPVTVGPSATKTRSAFLGEGTVTIRYRQSYYQDVHKQAYCDFKITINNHPGFTSSVTVGKSANNAVCTGSVNNNVINLSMAPMSYNISVTNNTGASLSIKPSAVSNNKLIMLSSVEELKYGIDAKNYCDFTVTAGQAGAAPSVVANPSRDNMTCSVSPTASAISFTIGVQQYPISVTNLQNIRLGIAPSSSTFVSARYLYMTTLQKNLKYGIDANNYCNFTITATANGPTVSQQSSGGNMICDGSATGNNIALSISAHAYQVSTVNNTGKPTITMPIALNSSGSGTFYQKTQTFLYWYGGAGAYCTFTITNNGTTPTPQVTVVNENYSRCKYSVSGNKVALTVDVLKYPITITNQTSNTLTANTISTYTGVPSFTSIASNQTTPVFSIPFYNPATVTVNYQYDKDNYCAINISSKNVSSATASVTPSHSNMSCTIDNQGNVKIGIKQYAITINNYTPKSLQTNTAKFPNASASYALPTLSTVNSSSGTSTFNITMFSHKGLLLSYGYDTNQKCLFTIKSTQSGVDVKASTFSSGLICQGSASGNNITLNVEVPLYAINAINKTMQSLNNNNLTLNGNFAVPSTLITFAPNKTSTFTTSLLPNTTVTATYGYDANHYCTFQMQKGGVTTAISSGNNMICWHKHSGKNLTFHIGVQQYTATIQNNSTQSLNPIILSGKNNLSTLAIVESNSTQSIPIAFLSSDSIKLKYTDQDQNHCTFEITPKGAVSVINQVGQHIVCNASITKKVITLQFNEREKRVIRVTNATTRDLSENQVVLPSGGAPIVLPTVKAKTSNQKIWDGRLHLNKPATIQLGFDNNHYCQFQLTENQITATPSGDNMLCTSAHTSKTITLNVDVQKYTVNANYQAPIKSLNTTSSKKVIMFSQTEVLKYGVDTNNDCQFAITAAAGKNQPSVTATASGINMSCKRAATNNTVTLTTAIIPYTFVIENLANKGPLHYGNISGPQTTDIAFPMIQFKKSYSFTQTITMPNNGITIKYGVNENEYCQFNITFDQTGRPSVSSRNYHGTLPIPCNAHRSISSSNKIYLEVGTGVVR